MGFYELSEFFGGLAESKKMVNKISKQILVFFYINSWFKKIKT